LGFLLTDELFSLSGDRRAYRNKYRLYYAVGAGGSFYLAWNAWTALGIIAGAWLPDMTDLGLDFAIAATFIALVIPDIKSLPILVCVLVSTILSVIFSIYEMELGLVAAALMGMTAGFSVQKLRQV
jgi:predicted branched-subunit amino acid permease